MATVTVPKFTKKAPMGKVDLGHEPEAFAMNGDVLTYGVLVNVDGMEPGEIYRFRYARHGGTEITVFGGLPDRLKMRSFRSTAVHSGGANLRLEAVKAEADERYEGLTPGQKAALTKRLRKAA